MSSSEISKKKKAVATWLLIGVIMIFIQIALGGITRLTGSGLSMTEWKPIMGFIPPINNKQWEEAFHGYQEIAQYKYVNNHFTLHDFKYIFFWEWLHRVWARALAVVFIFPFIYFLTRKYFINEMIKPLIILFILGALQGFIGWYMVQSGLNSSGLLQVSHVRLSIHLVSALVLLCYTLWFALKLLISEQKLAPNKAAKKYFIALIGLLGIQLFYGAFMAGLHAALYAPTWPKMNGYWLPPLLMEQSWINNPLNVQFIHRGLAYLLFILTVIGCIKIWRLAKFHNSKLLRIAASWNFILVSSQVALGIFAVIYSPYSKKEKFGMYEVLAQTHQLVAMCLLISFLISLYLLQGKSNEKSTLIDKNT